MSVVSSAPRQKSWQIAEEVVSLLEQVATRDQQLGARLRALSRARGFHSDEDAARSLGVSYRQYQRWLSGESIPRVSSLKLIAEKWEVPLEQLLGEPDKSQLDRIEGMLERLLELSGGQLTPEEEVAALADQAVELAEGAGGGRPGAKPPRSAGAAPAKGSGRTARRRGR